MNRACQQANTTQQCFPWTCDTNEVGTKETVEKGLPASAEKQLNVRFFFFCLFVTDTSFPYIRLDCFTYIVQVFTYIMPVKCVPIKAIMCCCSNGVLALRTYARPHATCCYQNPFDVTIWWREFSNEPQISIIT